MADSDRLEQRIKDLEAQLTDIKQEQAQLNKDLVEAQLDQWKGRIDELEVQMHLGRLEADDTMQPLIEQLRNRLLDARQQVDRTTSAAGDAIGALRSGVEQAMDDLRSAINRARSSGE
jgi:chromosome segregation ATPase